MRSHLDDPLCRTCRAEINEGFFEAGCPLCGNQMSHAQNVCGHCMVSPPAVQGFMACGDYDHELKELIKAYKYGVVTRLEPVLTALLRNAFQSTPFGVSFDGVVIVPKFKPAWRTFYPMKGVARRFSRAQGIRFMPDVLIKTKATYPQAALTGKARLINLKGVFKVRKNAALQGLNLLLIDDVSTTGSTVRYTAEPLHRAGAKVWVLVVAKAR